MTPEHQLRLVVLGSGSGGNSCAVTDGQTTVLIDCGFSAKELGRRLADAGIESASVNAILLTHEHSDHVRGAEVFARRYAHDCPVYATQGTLDASGLVVADPRPIRAGGCERVGTLDIIAFRTSHDASDPLGYRIEAGNDAVGLATDTGIVTEEIAEALRGCTTLALESNHDVDMLERGPYPPFLKRRIASAHGHLSNRAAADALEHLLSDRLRELVGMHRSRTNNTARLAEAALRHRVCRLGATTRVTVAAQDAGYDTHPPQGKLFG